MTCKEKLKIEHPDQLRDDCGGGCVGCPSHYGYLPAPPYCNGDELLCDMCWSRETQEDKENIEKAIQEENDPVNHPSHYTDGKIEVIDFIEDKKLGFHLGNAIKYIARAGKKDPTKTKQDLEKAVWYIERYIAGMGDV